MGDSTHRRRLLATGRSEDSPWIPLSVVLPICCGIDVHKNTLTACLLTTGASGKPVQEVRTFRTVTAQLQELARWLLDAKCPTVVLESTGVYWKPVFNVLEPAGLEVVL